MELKLDPRLSPVLIDGVQFETALLNLVTNARDAMPDGGTLTLMTENVQLGQNQVDRLPAGSFIKVTVKDTGTGMTPDVAARAIEPFFTTKEVGKGTGMGLSQVYGLIQQSGGDIEIGTEAGKGTSISIFLPALAAADNDGLASAETNAGNDKALVVDDEPDVLEVATELFRNLGYDVLSANNAAGAIEILKRTPDIDVLFSDVVMPDMNGVALGQAARKLIPGITVLLASGYPAPALTDENSSIRDFHFISKPYRMAEIVKKLRMAG
jgi:CheY-like chemotaxis protein